LHMICSERFFLQHLNLT